MIIEVLQWAELAKEIKMEEMTKRISDLILFLYVISYIFNKKGCLIVAFISCEVWAWAVWEPDILPGTISSIFLFAGYAATYCLLYFYIKTYITHTVTKLSGVVMMILLSTGMALDAFLYPKTKTTFWANYEVNVLLLHIYIIITFINWRLLRVHMGESARAILHILGVNDAARFCWYNLTKQAKL